MKYLLLIMSLLLSSIAFAQTANFEDDFTDQDILNWGGNNADFIFINEFGNILLKQDAVAAGSSQLSIPSTSLVGFWEFFVQLDFPPSDGNKVDFYLVSDSANFNQNLNGYMLQAGEDGSSDVFRLFKITAGVKDVEILTGTTSIASGGKFRVKVIRDDLGNWILEVANSYSAPTTQEAAGTDNTYTSTSFFGFQTTYTSTRSDKFIFDFKIDVPPIQVINASVKDVTTLGIEFSKDYDPTSLQNSDFTISPGDINPSSINQTSSSSLDLVFIDLPSGPFDLNMTSIEGANNQTILIDTLLTLFRFDTYQEGDIIVNEFLKDPPESLEEYIELKNTSSRFLNLRNWKLGDNSSLSNLSNQDVVILPDSFLVVTSDTIALKSVFGNVAALEVSLPAFNNTTDQIRLYNADGAVIDSLEYTPDWGGNNVAIERKSENAPSIFIENWSDSPSELGGTACSENKVSPDNTPPDLESLSFLNDSTIILVFNERINPDSANNTNNYSITVPGNIIDTENQVITATYLAPDSVELYLKLSEQENGTLEIFNQTDIFGNSNPIIKRDFQYIRTEIAQSGDIFINEFIYNPPTTLTEFVEIYNPTNKVFNLKGWTLSDNTGNTAVITNNDFYFRKAKFNSGSPDNPYVILTPDSSINIVQSNQRIVMGNRFPTLNNTTDAIVLKNPQGITIDSLTYSQDWGGEEVSLERRTVDVSGEFQENWSDSPSLEFATPSNPNLVKQDTDSPILQDAFITGSNSITLFYSESVQSSSAQNPSNYSFFPSLSISSIAVNRNEVSFLFSSNLENETTYTITLNNQKDIFGNILAESSVDVRYLIFSNPQLSDIIINEILYQKVDENSPEFIELYNRSVYNFDLSNWTISDAASNTGTIPVGTSIEPGEYIVLTDRLTFANSLSNGIFLPDFPTLNDNGDGITLKTDENITIDSLFYTPRFGGNEDGISAEKKDPNKASNDANNWENNSSSGGNSAGIKNSVFELDTIAPQLVFANFEQDGNIFIAFTEFINPTSTTFTIGEEILQVLNFDANNANQITVDGSSLQIGTPLGLSVSNLADVVGNTLNSATIQISQPVAKGDVIINEILYDPLADDEDNLPDQTEYIELYNTTDYAISLESIFLSDAPNEDNEINRLDPISATFKWIQPKGYFLIYAENQTSIFQESRLAEYFGLESETDQFTMQIDRSSLSLSASGDAIFVSDTSGITIDSVFFDESWHNPNRVSLNGLALEKISPTGPSNEKSNWSSSTAVNGGTPNRENSIFQEKGITPDNIGISFSPNPFSPDDDGFEDFLSINYTLDEADYLLRVRIYDRYGRKVRELVDGKPAGFSGNLIWDGLTDQANKNRVGIYIVLFEAYDSSNGKNQTFKETVVIARKF